MRVVCSPPPTTTVAGVGGIVEVSMAPVVSWVVSAASARNVRNSLTLYLLAEFTKVS